MQNPRPHTPNCIGSTTAPRHQKHEINVGKEGATQVCYMPRRARGKDNEQR